MVFPQTALDYKAEMYIGNTWRDISAYVYSRDPVRVVRGLQNEQGQAEASTVALTLDNRDQRFSWRNPNSTWFGMFSRNAQLRVSVPNDVTRLLMPGANLSNVSTPDSVGISITGDIDIRYDANLSSWGAPSTSAAIYLMGKMGAPGTSQYSWYLSLTRSGYLNFVWSPDGSSFKLARSTVPLPRPFTGRKAVRVTLDVDNGAAGNTATFYTSTTIGGAWTALGAAVVGAGTTSIFDSTAPLYVGDFNAPGGNGPIAGQVYAAKVLSGIGGSEKANPDFTLQSNGATSFVDAAGNTWTATTGTLISNRCFRGWGEIGTWPMSWDNTGRDVYVPVVASGLLRRLSGAGQPTLMSSMYRRITRWQATAAAPVAYWPCEDESGSTSLGTASVNSAGQSGYAMKIIGTASIAAYSGFGGSAPVPTVQGSQWRGSVRSYTGTGQISLHFLMHAPVGAIPAGTVLASMFTHGWLTSRWDVVYGGSNTLQINAWDGAYNSTIASGALDPTGAGVVLDGHNIVLDLQIQDSAGASWQLSVSDCDNIALSTSFAGSLAGATTAAAREIRINPGSVAMGDTAIGHIWIEKNLKSTYGTPNELNGWAGETAAERIYRLCSEEGVRAVLYGNGNNTPIMGPQTQQTLISLLRECEAVDCGYLAEPRDNFAVAYVTRDAMSAQLTPALPLDYTADHLGAAPQPTDDDALIRNDVTASRSSGSSYRVAQTTGSLSTSQPPNGVGDYASSVTVNVQTDDMLPDQASWRVNLGTVDEPRIPKLYLDLARSVIAGNAALTNAVRDLDIGGRVGITHVPAQLGPNDVSQLAVGFEETLAQFTWTISANCVPESPYHVAVWDDPTSRYSSDGTTVNGVHTAGTTSLAVTTPSGPLWTTVGGDYPFDLLIVNTGERMTATACAGGTVNQTFTVTRGVNGVQKALAGGETVTLFRPVDWAL